MTVKGKIALVTGAGSGLGKASALKLARKGADVAVLSRTKEEVDTVCAEIEALGQRALPLYADVSDLADMISAFDQIKQSFGRLDIVFANAGINGTWAPIDELDVEDWDQTIAINLRGTFLTFKFAVPLLKQQGGSIIVTSSINGTRTFTTAGASAYSTTKAGQLALVQMTALELAQYKIRVNAICPGAIESNIDENTNRENAERAAVPVHFPEGDIPLTGGEPGRAEDVADLVHFLASDASRHITGTPVWIDGGQSLLV
ncbi:SDR family oxidoreductase [Pelagibacterium luteolum]|uniref:NAD(P)-dependent dehydrogenase, short-chain alcohol dehydrogenase family n=1 Tax=Pelagibacterium luteolum TaxID=440168 RepID=A0A1G7X6E1_9HYPH|nr:SDR family NAD(P)-dependent oxidoreductase [Pelagibacterium luteolum]SDG79140.1 NAD(P)-dependent dehydrogenase, short-chain alcohol dehydrogenase family [Pelagibacterium luteolum]